MKRKKNLGSKAAISIIIMLLIVSVDSISITADDPEPNDDYITITVNGEEASVSWEGADSLPIGFGFYSAIWPAGTHMAKSDDYDDIQLTGVTLFVFCRFPVFNPGPFNAEVDGLITTTLDNDLTGEIILDADIEWGGWEPGCYLSYLFTLGRLPIFDLWDPYDPYKDVGIYSIHVDLIYKENGNFVKHYNETFYDDFDDSQPPGGGGGPATCFLAGTQITMDDGSYKNIENIIVGDTVKSYNITTREIVNTTVTKVHNHTPDEMTNHYLIINNNIKVTPNHIVFINDTLMRVKHAKVGDIIVGVDGEDTTIDSIEKVFTKVPTYNFEYMPMSDNLYITKGMESQYSMKMGAYPHKIKIKNPMKPVGKIHIDKGVKYSYSTFTVDIANDKLFYVFDWGDGTDSGWLGPINSGETVEASHIWTEEGKYDIKVNAKDSYDELSEWSETLAVAMVK